MTDGSRPGFLELLRARHASGIAPTCVGIDPRPDALPAGLLPGAPPADRIAAFVDHVLPVVAPHAAAVKPNIAFFERHGATGFAAYERCCRLARELGVPVIGDVKRGDIGATAEAYASVHLDLADAVTLHPLLGGDSLTPFLRRCRDEGRAVFVLVRTSNPGATDVQDARLAPPEDGTLSDRIARLVDAWGADLGDPERWSPVGAVVGATYPDELARLRRAMPRAPLLIPGVGAQGGRIADLGAAFDARGEGALVSQSRGILQCFAPDDRDWLGRIERAAAAFAAELAAFVQGNAG